MSLVDEDMISALAETAETGMITPIEIYRKTDAVNAFSDDGESYPDDPDVTTTGWFRSQPDASMTEEGGVAVHSEDPRLFVPRSISLDRGDKVVVNGSAYYVIDVNTDNTYRVLTRAALRRLD